MEDQIETERIIAFHYALYKRKCIKTVGYMVFIYVIMVYNISVDVY